MGKYVVIHDLEDFDIKKNEGGLYAIMPYERLDNKGKALFKVGQADNYEKHFEQYHTYYPLGMYYDNLLVEPRKIPTENRNDYDSIRQSDRTGKNRVVFSKKKYYNAIENYIFKEIKQNGGKQLISTTRVKNDAGITKTNRTHIGGDTEWFYTNEKTLNKSFNDAFKVYGGRNLEPSSLEGINKVADKNEKGANVYKAAIYYRIPPPPKTTK